MFNQKLEIKNKDNAYIVKNISTDISNDEDKIRNAIVKEKACLNKVNILLFENICMVKRKKVQPYFSFYSFLIII